MAIETIQKTIGIKISEDLAANQQHGFSTCRDHVTKPHLVLIQRLKEPRPLGQPRRERWG